MKMNYPKLDIFDVVELRDGRLAVVLPISEEFDETELGLYTRDYVFVSRITTINVFAGDSYNNDLTHNGSSYLDIMKVLKYDKIKADDGSFSYEAYMRMITDILIQRDPDLKGFKTFNIKGRLKPYGWTWEREEVKEVTMAEVEEKFGCKVKIVKEKYDT